MNTELINHLQNKSYQNSGECWGSCSIIYNTFYFSHTSLRIIVQSWEVFLFGFAFVFLGNRYMLGVIFYDSCQLYMYWELTCEHKQTMPVSSVILLLPCPVGILCIYQSYLFWLLYVKPLDGRSFCFQSFVLLYLYDIYFYHTILF